MYLKKIGIQNQKDKAYSSCSKTVNVTFRTLSCAENFYSKNCGDVCRFVLANIHISRLQVCLSFPV